MCAVAQSTKDNDTCRTRMLELFQKRPSLVQLLVTVLRHGGPDACEFVFGIARTLDQSPLTEPLYEFVTGQRGSQQLRADILSWLGSNNLISATVHRMWIDGEWHEIKTFQNEIYDEPTTPHSPEVSDKGAEAFYLIRGNPSEAERLLREALALEPDAPDLLNNLAMVLRLQGKHEEASRILHDVQQRFPDYFFGQIALAQELTDNGDHDAAQDILAKLIQQPRLHVSEFAAIGACYVRLATAVGDISEARSWLERIADVYPDYSELPTLRKITELAKLKQAVERRLG
jgi:tetratricopeptide (TPR) repeat protein